MAAVLAQLLPTALLCLLFAAVGVVHVTSRVLVVHAGYQMSKLDTEWRQLAREHDQLKLERATLLSPARLERLAREKLGLVPPPAGSVVSAIAAAPERQRATLDARSGGATAVRVANRVER
jgi:cell division protein FtsL